MGNTGGTGAYGFNMTDGNGILGNFIAWCLDLEHFLSSGLYETTKTPFSNSFGLNSAERARVQSVFDANYASLNSADNTQAAGFQVALWNALYDDDGVATAGAFAVAGGAVGAQADAFLTAAVNFAGPKQYNLTFLESLSTNPSSQNLVTVAPVPLPAAAGRGPGPWRSGRAAPPQAGLIRPAGSAVTASDPPSWQRPSLPGRPLLPAATGGLSERLPGLFTPGRLTPAPSLGDEDAAARAGGRPSGAACGHRPRPRLSPAAIGVTKRTIAPSVRPMVRLS